MFETKFRKIYLLLRTSSFVSFFLIFTLSSCSPFSQKGVAEQANENFEEHFSDNVEKINSQRIAPKRGQSTKSTLGTNNYSSADLDLSALPPGQFLEDATPNERTLFEGRQLMMQSQFPAGIFDPNYDTNQHGPFVMRGAEFDSIKIPEQDFYGIKSSLNAKQYLLVGNKALQKNIDKINSKKLSYDDELSLILVKEQKNLQRQRKFDELFKNDSSVVEEKKIKEEEEEEDKELAREDRIENQDPIKKMIALQVIEENRRNNAPQTEEEKRQQELNKQQNQKSNN